MMNASITPLQASIKDKLLRLCIWYYIDIFAAGSLG